MGKSFDFDPVDRIGVGAVGEPGRRQFFLRASGGGVSVVLNCEKFHVQGLVARIQERLLALGVDAGTELDLTPPPPAQPGESEWTVGELGLGYHEAKRRFVIVAREMPGDGERDEGQGEAAGDDPDSGTARFWAGEDQVRTFSRQAAAVLAGGRPTCTYCGLPIDAGGHPCPAANGSRPIF